MVSKTESHLCVNWCKVTFSGLILSYSFRTSITRSRQKSYVSGGLCAKRTGTQVLAADPDKLVCESLLLAVHLVRFTIVLSGLARCVAQIEAGSDLRTNPEDATKPFDLIRVNPFLTLASSNRLVIVSRRLTSGWLYNCFPFTWSFFLNPTLAGGLIWNTWKSDKKIFKIFEMRKIQKKIFKECKTQTLHIAWCGLYNAFEI